MNENDQDTALRTFYAKLESDELVQMYKDKHNLTASAQQVIVNELAKRTVPLPEQSSTTDRTLRKANYIVRHWRGEFSLPVSFWINGIGFYTLFYALSLFASLAPVVVGGQSKREFAFLLLMLLTVQILLSIWIAVGQWRSAAKYRAAGKSEFWAVSARIVLILGAILLAIELFTEDIPIIVYLLMS